MAYYPKKMVNTGLYTIGTEYIDPLTGQAYTGYYHQLYDDKVFTGKDPTDLNRRLLTQSTPLSPSNSQILQIKNNLDYKQLNQPNQEIYEFGRDPEYYSSIPTSEDYRRGNVIRYFAKRKNENPIQIREISKRSFEDISKQGKLYNYALWNVISIFWKITGPLNDSKDQYGIIKPGIVNTNERLREVANQGMRGIKSYLSNLIQYSIKPNLEIISNQYTGGGDLTIKQNNNDYRGYYHIMADGTIKDGTNSNQSQNQILLIENVLFQNQINTLVKESLSKLGVN